MDTLDKDDDELIFEEYIKRLGQVLEMRHRGKWVPETFDRYSESLVQVVAPPPPPRGPSMRGPHLPPLRPSLLSLLVRGFAAHRRLPQGDVPQLYAHLHGRVHRGGAGAHQGGSTPSAARLRRVTPLSPGVLTVVCPPLCACVQVSEVTEEVLGFAEMATMKIGELLNQVLIPLPVNAHPMHTPNAHARALPCTPNAKGIEPPTLPFLLASRATGASPS